MHVHSSVPGEPKYDAVPIPQGYSTAQGEYTGSGGVMSTLSPQQLLQLPGALVESNVHGPSTPTAGPSEPRWEPVNQYDSPRAPSRNISGAARSSGTSPDFPVISVPNEALRPQEPDIRPQRDPLTRAPGDPVLPASVRRRGDSLIGDGSSAHSPPPIEQIPTPRQPASPISDFPSVSSQIQGLRAQQATPVASQTPDVRITPPPTPAISDKHKYPESEPNKPPAGLNLPVVHPQFADEKIPVMDEPEREERIVMSATSYPGQAWEPECFWMDGE